MSTLIAHGACLLWQPELIWLNAICDALVAIALFTTGFVLASFVWWRRGDIMPLFSVVFSTYAIFIAMCGVTRLLWIVTLWMPAYGMEATIKAVAAVMSLGITAGLLRAPPPPPTFAAARQGEEA